MTEKELKLLEIAKETIHLNEHLGAKLTGSLMLAISGLNKRRDASDIDIICDYLCERDDGFPIVPSEFKEIQMDGSKSEVGAIQFVNKDGLKIEFMYSEELSTEINGVQCGELKWLIDAKRRYSENDKDDESRKKHIDDLKYLFENNHHAK